MFEKRYEQRLEAWSSFRDSLEESEDPLRDVVTFYSNAPYVSIHTDPWDQSTWPTPWELLNENLYDDFCRVLGMCYSLQLTDRFKGSTFEIHICTLNNLSQIYLLFIDNGKYVLGYDDEIISTENLPSDLRSQEIYRMPGLH